MFIDLDDTPPPEPPIGNRSFLARLTPTQRRIMNLLLDGLPHEKEEIHMCLDDWMAQPTAIQRHISVLRALIPPGTMITCLHKPVPGGREIYYQLVRAISPNDQ